MKRSWLIVGLLLSLGINIGVLAVIGVSQIKRSSGWEPPPGRSGEAPLARMAERLGLEGEARDEFLGEQRRFFEAFRETRIELEQSRRRLRSAVTSEPPDREEIEALLTDSSELTARLDRLFVEHVLTARRLLEPRQQRLYFGFLQRLQRQGERFGRS